MTALITMPFRVAAAEWVCKEVETTTVSYSGKILISTQEVCGFTAQGNSASAPKWRALTAFEKRPGTGYEYGFGSAICLRPYMSLENPGEIALLGECETRRGPSTSVLVARAFQSLTIPKSRIVIQPPGGVTLVNMATLFRTEAVAYDESIRLLGRSITLRITPVQFVWQTGDGASFTTTTPGIPYEKGVPMSDYVSHKYLQAAKKVSPSVNVVWSAQYSVAGGPWQDVDGTVTTIGPGAQLRVREAVPVLTSGG